MFMPTAWVSRLLGATPPAPSPCLRHERQLVRHEWRARLVDSSIDIRALGYCWETLRNRLRSVRIFEAHIDDDTPKEITAEGNIVALHPLPSGDLLISRNSLTSSIGYFIFNPSSKHFKTLLLPTDVDPQLADLSKITVEGFSFDGAETRVHGFIVKPSDFDSSKKTRLAFLIHGGPQGAWTDSWNTRWNPALFAEAGYIVVAVNPTGSTGYGQAFTDAIQNQWGGLPYIDLVKSIEYLEDTEEYNYIDFDKAVALGASYGGYMINYIQGMPLGKKFQALVCYHLPYSSP